MRTTSIVAAPPFSAIWTFDAAKARTPPSSLFAMVSTAVDGTPRRRPFGLPSVRFTVRSGLTRGLSLVATVNVRLASPALNVSVPLAGV